MKILLLIVSLFVFTMPAFANEGYLGTAFSQILKDGYGECVHTAYFDIQQDALAECDEDIDHK